MTLRSLFSSLKQAFPNLTPEGKAKAAERLSHALEEYQSAREQSLPYDQWTEFRIVVFGSARISPEEAEYQDVMNLTEFLARNMELEVVTGGGPSIMKAAFEGLRKVHPKKDPTDSKTHGVAICIKHESKISEEADWARIHSEFLTRIQEMVDLSQACYIAPGGIGTVLEMAVFLQLKQVGHLPQWFPIILHPMWEPLLTELRNTTYKERVDSGLTPTITDGDVFQNLVFTSDPEEILQICQQARADWKQEREKMLQNSGASIEVHHDS